MGTIADIATIVGLVRDVVLLIILTVALIALVMVFGKVRQLLSSAQATADVVRETVEKISERVVEPATSNVGAARRIGGIAGFLLGLMRRKRRDNSD